MKVDSVKSKQRRADSNVRAQRVEHIIGRMRELTWERGKTARALAAEWGCTLDTVHDMSAEASRAIAREFEPESVRSCINLRMEQIMRIGSDKDAIRAADVAARLAGVYAAQRIDVSADLEKLSDAELERLAVGIDTQHELLGAVTKGRKKK